MKLFLYANNVFKNIASSQVIKLPLAEDTVVDEIIRESRHWFRDLNDVEDAKPLRQALWKLKSTLQMTLLRFDDPELQVSETLKSILDECQFYPSLNDRSVRLKYAINQLLKNPVNSKSKTVIEILNEHPSLTVGIVTSLTRWSTPGWTHNAYKFITQNHPKVSFINSKTQLRNNIFDCIIIPGNARHSPLLGDIMSGAYCSKLFLTYYKEEGFFIPKPGTLPRSTINLKSKTRQGDIKTRLVEEKDTEMNLWYEEKFWDDIREDIRSKNDFVDQEHLQHQFTINARLVLLEDGSKVFLPEGKKNTEISELIEGEATLGDFGRSFPRKLTEELSHGDLIVLRTEGGGDYVVDIANNMMAKDGKIKILRETEEWKKLLNNALKQFGVKKINTHLGTKGCSYKSDNYIWMLATDQIIGPQEKMTFLYLLETLSDLDCCLNDSPDNLLKKYWPHIKEIRAYRRNAGKYLRKELLKKLKTLIRKKVQIGDKYTLHLSGESKGSITVFRVSALDETTSQIPYFQSGIVIN